MQKRGGVVNVSPKAEALVCDCGHEYEIRDDTPKWCAARFVCPTCFLADNPINGGEPASDL